VLYSHWWDFLDCRRPTEEKIVKKMHNKKSSETLTKLVSKTNQKSANSIRIQGKDTNQKEDKNTHMKKKPRGQTPQKGEKVHISVRQ